MLGTQKFRTILTYVGIILVVVVASGLWGEQAKNIHQIRVTVGGTQTRIYSTDVSINITQQIIQESNNHETENKKNNSSSSSDVLLVSSTSAVAVRESAADTGDVMRRNAENMRANATGSNNTRQEEALSSSSPPNAQEGSNATASTLTRTNPTSAPEHSIPQQTEEKPLEETTKESFSITALTMDPHTLQLLLQKEQIESEQRAYSSNLTTGVLQESTSPRFHPLHTMFQGPSAPYLDATDQLVYPASKQSTAMCQWTSAQWSQHFPHAMQELYRCFSWWQANAPHQKPFLDRDGKGIDGFLRGFMDMLQASFGVRTVPKLHSTQKSNYVYTDINSNKIPPHLVKRPWFQMHRPQDAALLRKETLNYLGNPQPTAGCPAAEHNNGDGKNPLPVIGFLNRKGPRHAPNDLDIVKAIQQAGIFPGNNNLTIHHLPSFDGLSFRQQVEFMSKVDILIGPHGAQFTSVAYLPACGGLLELFPKGYYVPRYFGSLAKATGHYHVSLYTGDGNNIAQEVDFHMATINRRMAVRSAQVVAQPELVVRGVQVLAERWQMCCERRQKGDTVESVF